MKASVIVSLVAGLVLVGFTGETERDLEMRFRQGEYEEVIALLSERFRAGRLSYRERLLLALALRGTGDSETAESILTDLLESDPTRDEVRLALAELYLDSGELWKATALLRSAGKSDRGMYLWGVSFLKLGSRDRAESFFSRVGKDTEEARYVSRIREVLGSFSSALELRAGYDTNPAVTPQEGFISPTDTPTYSVLFLNRAYLRDLRVRTDLLYTRFERVPSYNTLEVNLAAELQRGQLLLPVRLGYTGLGGDFYRLISSAGVGAVFGGTELLLVGSLQDYRDVGGRDDDRDGYRISLEGEHVYPVRGVVLKTAASLSYEDTKGRNWDSVSLYPRLSLQARVGQLSLSFTGGAAYYLFLNRNTLTGDRRRDLFLTAAPSARLFFRGRLFVDVSYTFRRNVSSLSWLSYVRHTFSVGAGGVF